MAEQDKIEYDEQLQELKEKYQQIDTDATLDWQRLERYESLKKQKQFVVKLLKFAAGFIIIGAVLSAVLIGLLVMHIHNKIQSKMKTVAYTGVKPPQPVNPPSMPGPGGMGTISSYMSKQKVSMTPDFNKMPNFSMPSMVSKSNKKERK